MGTYIMWLKLYVGIKPLPTGVLHSTSPTRNTKYVAHESYKAHFSVEFIIRFIVKYYVNVSKVFQSMKYT